MDKSKSFLCGIKGSESTLVVMAFSARAGARGRDGMVYVAAMAIEAPSIDQAPALGSPRR